MLDILHLALALVSGGLVWAYLSLRDERDSLEDRLASISMASLKGAVCNLCGGPRCLHCNSFLDGNRSDGYCSDACAEGPSKMREPLGMPRGPARGPGEMSKADLLLLEDE